MKRKPRHVNKIMNRWYQCETSSRSESKQILIRVENEGGRHLWGSLVYDIKVDQSLSTFPNVFHTEQEGQNAMKNSKHAPRRRTEWVFGQHLNSSSVKMQRPESQYRRWRHERWKWSGRGKLRKQRRWNHDSGSSKKKQFVAKCLTQQAKPLGT